MGELLTEIQHALGISQKELGAIMGRDRRTIQRWQVKGTVIFRPDVEKLAAAVRPVRADLADRLLALADASDRLAGKAPPPGAEVIEEIVKAGAVAGGTSAEGMRRGMAAAFARAEELGVEVQVVIAALRR